MRSLPTVKLGIIKHVIDDELLVYNASLQQMHVLDSTTTCVFRILEEGNCDDWDSLTGEVSRRLGIPASPEIVSLALDELEKADMLKGDPGETRVLNEVTRRDMLRKIALVGATALAIPAIATLTANAAYGQACRTVNQACSPQLCCSGLRCVGGTCVV